MRPDAASSSASCADVSFGFRPTSPRIAAMSSPNPFERDLDRNAANYTPLTPLSLIARTRLHLPAASRRGPRRSPLHVGARPTRAAAVSRRRSPPRASAVGDTVALMAANTPEMFEAHFGVPMTGGVLNTLNTRLDAEAIAFMLRARRGQGPDHRHRVRADRREGAGAAARRSRCVIDIDDPLGPGGKRLGKSDYETFIAAGDPDFAVGAPGRRVERDLAQLHVRHDGQPEGCRLPPSRRVPERAVQHHRLGDAAARGLSVDAADVPLQRLVLPVDDGRQRRRQRLPAQGRRQVDSGRDPHAQGHALLRRADRPPDADQRAGGDEGGHRSRSCTASSPAPRRRPP